MIDFLKKLKELSWPYRARLVFGIIFGILAGLMEPLMIGVVAFVYSVIFQEATLAGSEVWWKKLSPRAQEIISDLIHTSSSVGGRYSILFLCAIPLVFFLRGLLSYLNVYLLHWVSTRVIADLRVRLFTHLLSLPASFFSASKTSELMSRIMADTDALRATISGSISSLIKDPVTLISLLAMLLWQQPKITLVSMLVLPLCVLPISIFSRKGRKAARTLQRQTAEMAHSMMESFTGNRIVKAYNMEGAVAKEFRDVAMQLTGNYMRLVRSLEIPGALLEFAGAIGIALVLAYILGQPDKRPDGSAFLILALSIISMYRPMKTLVRVHASMGQARAASERVFDLLATKSTLPEPANPKPLRAAGAPVRFENVSFAYKDKPVLSDIQLTVKAGSFVALVGATGSGKTTLTNLILRFYDPTSGAIYVGDTDLRDVTTKALRDQIAIVTQETVLFNDTIRNNIALGRPGATNAEIEAAAKHAHAHEFIIDKPEGYDTEIGERGVTLSGGQRQRLAIARAILKDAPILILDEATSALDTEVERAVQEALEVLMVGRTTFCIAHRLSTIRDADMIVVMDAGRIVETGTHEELIARAGIYANLHRLQFKTAG
jgi:subfamily B ATP-binding cassette protein MsbA